MIHRRLARLASALGLAALAGLLPVGAALAQQAQPRGGGTITYATGLDAQTLDPQFVVDIPTSRIVRHLYEPIVEQDESGKIVPALATSWTVSDDKRTWTFKLRKGVTFHDGTPFNAAAVKFNYDRIVNPATGSPRRSTLDAVESVRVVDDETLAITTKQPFAPLLAQLSAYNIAIMSPTQVQKVGADIRKSPSGTGPFKLQSWQPGERMTLVRNDAYWGGRPRIETLQIRVVPEDSARVLLLLSGEADVVSGVPTVMLKRLSTLSAVKVMRKTGYRTIYLGMNLAVPPFNDLRVRQAVAHAVNKPALVQGVLAGVGTLGGSYESPVIEGATKDLPPYAHDPAKARKLLAEAGFPNGFETDFYVPTGLYIMDRPLGEAIQAQLAEVGIKARIQAPDTSTYISLLNQAKAPMFLGGKGSPTGDLDFTQTLSNGSTGRMNHFNFKSAEVDKLIAEQRGIVDPERRRAVLRDLQHAVYREAPHVTLYYEDQVFATRSNVRDFRVFVNEFVSFAKAWKE